MSDMVTNMICGCCTEPISQIPADWASARRILNREVRIPRRPHERCDECAGHNVYDSPCAPADFARPGCQCGCND